jgi:hypothetical protein
MQIWRRCVCQFVHFLKCCQAVRWTLMHCFLLALSLADFWTSEPCFAPSKTRIYGAITDYWLCVRQAQLCKAEASWLRLLLPTPGPAGFVGITVSFFSHRYTYTAHTCHMNKIAPFRTNVCVGMSLDFMRLSSLTGVCLAPSWYQCLVWLGCPAWGCATRGWRWRGGRAVRCCGLKVVRSCEPGWA